MGKYNDLDLSQWREYTDIETDSLWIIDKRDNSGAHSGHYHGNFVPQIPHQLFSRYTKKGDWILDPFMGSGTSLIEAQRMGRNSIGIEIQHDVAKEAYDRINTEKNDVARTKVVVADSQTCDMNKILLSEGINKVQFVIMHPPYWDMQCNLKNMASIINRFKGQSMIYLVVCLLYNKSKNISKLIAIS